MIVVVSVGLVGSVVTVLPFVVVVICAVLVVVLGFSSLAVFIVLC